MSDGDVIPFPGKVAPKPARGPMPASTLAALARALVRETVVRETEPPALSKRGRENFSVELETIVLDLERKSDALKRIGYAHGADAIMTAAELIDYVAKMVDFE